MGVDSKVLIILKDSKTDPMDIVSLIESRLKEFVNHENKNMPLNFKKTHPIQYNLIHDPITVDKKEIDKHQYGFIFFRYYSNDPKEEFCERRRLYFGFGDNLNEEFIQYEFIKPHHKLMTLSTGYWGKNHEFIQEIISAISDVCENIYVDINDCDEIDYEDQFTFFKKYGSRHYLLKWL